MTQQLIGGFMEGCIADVYTYLPAFFANMNILFTVRDSGTWTTFVPDEFTQDIDYIDVNGRLFLKSHVVSEFLDQVPFIDFSEVYFIPECVPAPTYAAGKFNTDAYNFNDSIPAEFLDIFKRCGAARFLSDGCGLNYYCESKWITALKEIYNE